MRAVVSIVLAFALAWAQVGAGMSEIISEMIVKFRAETAELEKRVGEVEKRLDQTAKSAGGAKSAVGGLGDAFQKLAGISIAGATAIGLAGSAINRYAAFLRDSSRAAAEAELVQARFNAVYRATGGAVGMTQVELARMATNMSRLAAVDDEAIVGAQMMLMRYGSLGREIFPQVMQAALDMSAALGGDVASNAANLGFVLELVAQGADGAEQAAGRLRRQGVILSESQVKLMTHLAATGQTAAAQRVVIEALADTYGGAAAATADTFAGAQARLATEWQNYKEIVGATVNEGLRPAYEWMTRLIEAEQRRFRIATEINRNAAITGGMGTMAASLSFAAREDGLKRAASAGDAATASYWAMAEAAEAGAFSTGRLAAETEAGSVSALEAGRNYSAMATLVQKAYEENQKFAEREAEIVEEINRKRAQKYSEEGSTLKRLKQELADVRAEAEAAQRAMVFEVITSRFQKEGLLDTQGGYEAWLGIAQGLGQVDAEAAEQARKAWDIATMAVQTGGKAVQDAINALDGKTITIGVLWEWMSTMAQAPSAPPEAPPAPTHIPERTLPTGAASGGFRPSGLPIVVGEAGPELLYPLRGGGMYILDTTRTKRALSAGARVGAWRGAGAIVSGIEASDYWSDPWQSVPLASAGGVTYYSAAITPSGGFIQSFVGYPSYATYQAVTPYSTQIFSNPNLLPQIVEQVLGGNTGYAPSYTGITSAVNQTVSAEVSSAISGVQASVAAIPHQIAGAVSQQTQAATQAQVEQIMKSNQQVVGELRAIRTLLARMPTRDQWLGGVKSVGESLIGIG